uniref:Uncharacterized protein n=1 Tax=Panagrolaimus sp. JU765 TaxID=591449 RepID=A0AC34RRM1_9BILA
MILDNRDVDITQFIVYNYLAEILYSVFLFTALFALILFSNVFRHAITNFYGFTKITPQREAHLTLHSDI